MRGWPVTYSDFSGGLNTQNAPYLLEDSQARDCLNVHTSLSGDIEKRNGFVTLATLSGAPVEAVEVHTLFPANTSTKSLLAVARRAGSDVIFKLTTGGTPTVLKTGLTVNKRWYWAQADVNAGEGPIFGLNGTDTPQRWNGTDGETHNWVATTGEVPKKAKYLTYFSSRLWCAEGSRLRYSGITGSTPDPLNWDAENFVDLDPNDGEEITAINIAGSFLIVAKARKTYAIYDPITAANRMISAEIGCVAHRSMVQTPVGLLFLSEDQGICKTDGNTVTPFSDQIKPTLDALNTETKPTAAATLSGRRYYVSVSLSGAANDRTIEYDLIRGGFWPHDCKATQFALLDPEGSPTLYSASGTTVSKAFVPEVFTDAGAKYAGKSYHQSAEYAWGSSGSMRFLRYIDPHKSKRIREVRIDGIGNWEAFIATDFSESFEEMEGEVWESNEAAPEYFGEGSSKFGEGSAFFGGSPLAVVERHYHTPGKGRAFSFKYVNDDTSNFKILSATYAIQMRED